VEILKYDFLFSWKYMQSEISNKWALFVSSILWIIVFWIWVFFLTLNFSDQISYAKNSSVSVHVAKKIPIFTWKVIVWLPVRLKISKIKISASIKSLWLTAAWAMDVHKGPYDVTWYNLWPRPGEKGSAVIAWHYGVWKNGAVSVFNTLNTLVKGDKISIEDDKGMLISFIVRETKIYALNADASEVFYSTDGKSHLNLITCIQDKVTKKYPNRLVIFADKEILTGAK